jgi:hypothetical protein
MEKFMGVAFPGTTITLPLREAAGAPLKYKTQSVVPAIWLVRRFFLFVRMLFVEKLGVLMTDKGGFL